MLRRIGSRLMALRAFVEQRASSSRVIGPQQVHSRSACATAIVVSVAIAAAASACSAATPGAVAACHAPSSGAADHASPVKVLTQAADNGNSDIFIAPQGRAPA